MVKLKKIGGSLYERWSVWFNPIIHEKSYQSIQKYVKINLTRISELFLIGTAWLSSVRVVKCNIQLLNERNLYDKFHIKFLLKIHSNVLNGMLYYLFKNEASSHFYTFKLLQILNNLCFFLKNRKLVSFFQIILKFKTFGTKKIKTKFYKIKKLKLFSKEIFLRIVYSKNRAFVSLFYF